MPGTPETMRRSGGPGAEPAGAAGRRSGTRRRDGRAAICGAICRGRPVSAILIDLWGRSSAGRAPRSQCGGREFDPPRLHHHSTPNLYRLGVFVSGFRDTARVSHRQLAVVALTRREKVNQLVAVESRPIQDALRRHALAIEREQRKRDSSCAIRSGPQCFARSRVTAPIGANATRSATEGMADFACSSAARHSSEFPLIPARSQSGG